MLQQEYNSGIRGEVIYGERFRQNTGTRNLNEAELAFKFMMK